MTAPVADTPCLYCWRMLDAITQVTHEQCGGWMFTQSRTDLPMTPCGCPVCWPEGRKRPARPDPQEQVARIVRR